MEFSQQSTLGRNGGQTVIRSRATRTARRFVPTSVAALEGRLVLSVVAPSAGGPAALVRPGHLTRAEIAQSNASEIPFGFDTGETLASSIPVAEQKTITYNDGSTQTESVLEIPNTPNNTITTYETINLRHNGGTETVVDTEIYSAGRPTADGARVPIIGNHRTHAITITLPNGSTKTETENVVIAGHKTFVTITIHEPNGGVETQSNVKYTKGPTTVTNRTITVPNGSVEHQKNITTNWGALDSTSFTTTILPDGKVERSSSATNVIRVQPPSSE
jgi:hypothetical protein